MPCTRQDLVGTVLEKSNARACFALLWRRPAVDPLSAFALCWVACPMGDCSPSRFVVKQNTGQREAPSPSSSLPIPRATSLSNSASQPDTAPASYPSPASSRAASLRLLHSKSLDDGGASTSAPATAAPPAAAAVSTAARKTTDDSDDSTGALRTQPLGRQGSSRVAFPKHGGLVANGKPGPDGPHVPSTGAPAAAVPSPDTSDDEDDARDVRVAVERAGDASRPNAGAWVDGDDHTRVGQPGRAPSSGTDAASAPSPCVIEDEDDPDDEWAVAERAAVLAERAAVLDQRDAVVASMPDGVWLHDDGDDDDVVVVPNLTRAGSKTAALDADVAVVAAPLSRRASTIQRSASRRSTPPIDLTGDGSVSGVGGSARDVVHKSPSVRRSPSAASGVKQPAAARTDDDDGGAGSDSTNSQLEEFEYHDSDDDDDSGGGGGGSGGGASAGRQGSVAQALADAAEVNKYFAGCAAGVYTMDHNVTVHVGISLRRLGLDQETALAWGFSYDLDSLVTVRVKFSDQYVNSPQVRREWVDVCRVSCVDVRSPVLVVRARDRTSQP